MESQGADPRSNSIDYSQGHDQLRSTYGGLSAEGQRAALERVMAEIRRLDLERNVVDLAVQGYTVLPPERVASPDFIRDLRDKVLEVAHRRSGVEPDLATGASHVQFDSPFGQMPKRILFEDPIFEQALMHEASVALVNQLVGERSLLSSSRGFVKAPGGQQLDLHIDFVAPAPFPPYSSMCNVTWALTDYSEDNGGIAFVPGSHRLGRRPSGDEGLSQAVAINAPAGSMIVFDGYVWHGAFPRRGSGLRVALAYLFCRPYIFTLERYQDDVPKAVLARNSQRFADFMGDYLGWESGPEGAPMSKLGQSTAAAMSLY